MTTVAVKMPENVAGEVTTINPLTIKYTLIQIYLEQGLSTRKISKLVHVSNNAIMQVKRGERVGSIELASRLKEQLASKFTINASEFLDHANQPDKLDKASTLQLVTAAGISVDKARLLNNESTMNVSVRDVHQDIVLKQDRFAKLLDEVER